jgi:hypothetical protein
MIGTLVYILLDVSFNVLTWSGKKTINGVVYISNCAYNSLVANKEDNLDNLDNSNNSNKLAIELPDYNNVLKEIEEERKMKNEIINRENINKMNELKLLLEENENTMNKIKKILN